MQPAPLQQQTIPQPVAPKPLSHWVDFLAPVVVNAPLGAFVGGLAAAASPVAGERPVVVPVGMGIGGGLGASLGMLIGIQNVIARKLLEKLTGRSATPVYIPFGIGVYGFGPNSPPTRPPTS